MKHVLTLLTALLLAPLTAVGAAELTAPASSAWLARELVPAETPLAMQTQLALHGLFTDGMVLQRGVAVPIWGWGPEGAEVRVYFDGKETTTKVANNCWSLRLPAMTASKQGRTLTVVCGTRCVVLKDVLVGEVWLCSGQSNSTCEMKLDTKAYPRRQADIARTTNAQIRFFKVDSASARQPRHDVPPVRDELYSPWINSFLGNCWRPCAPEWSPHVSATAFYFATELQPRLDCPLGVIICGRGGSSIVSWVPANVIKAESCWSDWRERLERVETDWDKFAKPRLDSMREFVRKYPTPEAHYKAQLAVKPAIIPLPRQLWWPTCFYNGMLHPMAPFGIKGVLWYQGETDAGNPAYAEMLASLIRHWRELWQQAELPFVIAQLAGYGEEGRGTAESKWAELRECQSKVAGQVPRAFLAVLHDAGMRKNIHPYQKEIAGARLALVARREVYGQNIACHGPRFQTLQRQGNTLVIGFTETGTGLVAKDVNLDGIQLKSEKLVGFAVCGADRKFAEANARIAAGRVIVSCDGILDPVAVRYAWADFPIANLYNREGFPAVPFQADLAATNGGTNQHK